MSWHVVFSIGGRLWSPDASRGGAVSEIPPSTCRGTNPTRWGTASAGQFVWGGSLLKSNGGVQRLAYHGWKPWWKCIRISQLDCETDRSSRYESRRKWSGPSGWKGVRSTDKSYSGDNRLMGSKSSHRRSRLAPRCRLVASWGCSRSQGLGCSPIKAARELGSERRETVRLLSATPVGDLREAAPSTRGPEWASLWCAGCPAKGTAG